MRTQRGPGLAEGGPPPHAPGGAQTIEYDVFDIEDDADLDQRDGRARAATDAEATHAVRRLFGRDSVYVILWTAQFVLAGLLTPINTRLLGKSNFGTTAAAVAVMQLLVAVGSFSLQTAVQRQYAQPDGERQARRLVTLAILISAVTFAVAYSTGPIWGRVLGQGIGGFSGGVHFAVIWAALTAVSNAGLGLLRSRDQLLWFGVVSLLQSVIAETLAVSLVAFVHRSASEWLIGHVIAQAAAVAVAVAVSRPLLLRRRDAQMVRTAVRYSAGLMPAVVAGFVLDAVDRLIISHDLGSAAVGRYAVARNIGATPLLVLGALSTAWLPRLFALSDDAVRGAVIARTRDAIFKLLIPMLVGVSVGAPLLLVIWVPANFDPQGLWLIVTTMSITALPVAGMLTASWVLMLTDRTFPVAVCTGISAVANVVLNIVLVPTVGIEGSALATVASYGLLYALLARVAHGQMRIAHLPQPLVIACVLSICAAVGLSQVPAGPVMVVVRGLVSVACILLFASVLAELVAPLRYQRLSRLAGVLERGIPRRAPPPALIGDELEAPTAAADGLAVDPRWGVTLGLSAAFALSLAVLGLGYAVDAEALRLVGVFGALVFGIGVAPAQLAPGSGLVVRVGIGGLIGLSVMLLGGVVMALVPVWHPVPFAVILVVAAAAAHAAACRRALAGVRVWDALRAAEFWGRLGIDSSVACSVVGTVLWVGAALGRGHVVPTAGGGFLSSISVLWYVGLVLLLAAIALARDKTEAHAMFALVSLVCAFTATPALVYGMPRSQTAVKHVELAQQILHTHRLNRGSGIYEAYSAFFAGVAWICDLARVRDSIGLATWWPFAIGLLRLAALRFFFGRLVSARYRIWAAMTLVVLVDAISADYFSPQSVGYVLGLGVYALALGRDWPGFGLRTRVGFVLLAGCALAVTHELSPYIVGGVLVVLAASRAVRPWYLAAACFAPAGLWALLNRHVLAGFINFSDLGNLANFSPPPTISTPGLTRLAIVGYASDALLLGILALIVLACIGLARTFRRRPSWGFFVSAGVGIIFIAVNPYGREGIFRAALFGIPWLAVLAIVALRTNPPRWVSAVYGLATVGLLATFLTSSFGLDNQGVVRTTDLAAFRLYETRALGRGDLLNLSYGDIPSTVASTGAIDRLVIWSTVVARSTLTAPPTPRDAASLARRYAALAAKKTGTPASELYALWSPAAATYGVNYGLETLAHAQEWRDRLIASPDWRVVYHQGGTYLFKVVSTAA